MSETKTWGPADWVAAYYVCSLLLGLAIRIGIRIFSSFAQGAYQLGRRGQGARIDEND